MSNKKAKTGLASIAFDSERYVKLLGLLIGESEKLQNSAAMGLVPREDCCSDHVLEALKPYTVENGGPLTVERVSLAEGRGNVIINYPGTTSESLAFVGSHMDVVPANPET